MNPAAEHARRSCGLRERYPPTFSLPQLLCFIAVGKWDGGAECRGHAELE